MESSETIIIDFELSRKKTFLLIVLLLFLWRPGFLGSETLTLTSYYPAPYGGYAKILTTGDTLLARDSGKVGIGIANVPAVHDQSNTKLYVNGDIANTGSVAWGGFQSMLSSDQGGSIELGGNNGTPYIDFKKSNEDYSNRIIMGSNSTAPSRLTVTGDFEVQGGYKNACEYRPFSSAGVTYCGGSPSASINYSIVGVYDENGNDNRLNVISWYSAGVVYYPQAGLMLCCRFSAP